MNRFFFVLERLDALFRPVGVKVQYIRLHDAADVTEVPSSVFEVFDAKLGKTVMQLSSLMKSDRLCAYDVSGASVLLLFIRHGTLEPVDTGRGIIPPHDGVGRLHMAFACSHDALPEWEDHLTAHGIAIEGRTGWKRGSKSMYFRDPDENLLELAASPGLWPGF